MKDLTTFFYGLFFILIGSSIIVSYKSLNSFSEYAWCTLGLLNIIHGYNKCEKSTN